MMAPNAPSAAGVPAHEWNSGRRRCWLSRSSARRSGPQLSRWMWLVKWFLAHSALHPARVLVARVLDHHRRRWVRDPVHRALPALTVQLQRGCPPVELASWLLRLFSTRHGSVPAVYAGPHELSRRFRRGVSRTAVPRTRAGEVVAARNPAPGHRGAHHHTVVLDLRSGLDDECAAEWRDLVVGSSGADRRSRALVHGALSTPSVRLHSRLEPVDLSGHNICRADAGRIPSVPPRPRPARPCRQPPRSRSASCAANR